MSARDISEKAPVTANPGWRSPAASCSMVHWNSHAAVTFEAAGELLRAPAAPVRIATEITAAVAIVTDCRGVDRLLGVGQHLLRTVDCPHRTIASGRSWNATANVLRRARARFP
jgi:hypothetical protein